MLAAIMTGDENEKKEKGVGPFYYRCGNSQGKLFVRKIT
jgi:hypothetical protein